MCVKFPPLNPPLPPPLPVALTVPHPEECLLLRREPDRKATSYPPLEVWMGKQVAIVRRNAGVLWMRYVRGCVYDWKLRNRGSSLCTRCTYISKLSLTLLHMWRRGWVSQHIRMQGKGKKYVSGDYVASVSDVDCKNRSRGNKAETIYKDWNMKEHLHVTWHIRGV